MKRQQPAISYWANSRRWAVTRLTRSDAGWSGWTAFALAATLAILVALSGLHAGADKALQLVRDDWTSRPATGQIHIVEIDAASLKRIDTFPWPRRHHAAVIDRLRKAGAAQIAFDVDFSAASNATDDAALAAALARADGSVIIPTFVQADRSTGGTLETLPLPQFARHAFLASVNVLPDSKGQVASYQYGTVTDGMPRPSIGVMLASGASTNLTDSFRIDQSIDPETLPRHSFADILAGKFDPADIRGKTMLIGATAIELGDRYATPGHGILHGVVIQALAAETLIQGRVNPPLGPWPLLVLVMIGLAAMLMLRGQRPVLYAVGAIMLPIAVLALPFLVEGAGMGSLQLVPAMAMIFGFAVIDHALKLVRKVSADKATDKATGLPNLAALTSDLADIDHRTVVVARIVNYAELSAQHHEKATAAMIAALAQRIGVIVGQPRVYRVDTDDLAWALAMTPDDPVFADSLSSIGLVLRHGIEVSPGETLVPKVVLGVAQGEGAHAARLIELARLAAQTAQQRGLTSLVSSDALMSETAETQLMVNDIDRAMGMGEIFMVYQPKWGIAQDRVVACEALMRWRKSDGTMVNTGQFIALLEREGRMADLTLFSLKLVLADLLAWKAQGTLMPCAVNISATIIGDSEFFEQATDLIAAADLDDGDLIVEITESSILQSADAAIAHLNMLKAMGVRISIDDYGTGQSTLSYLQSFPADEIKIDQGFIRALGGSDADRIMVESTISMAHALDLKVVAEGVETAIIYNLLADMGCDVVQGWHIGRPVSAGDFATRWLNGPEGLNGSEAAKRQRA